MKRLLLVVFLSGVHFAYAAPVPELMKYMAQQTSDLDEAVNRAERACGPDSPNDEASASENERWYFNLFLLKVQAKVGISVPGLVSFQLLPDVEMVWQRSNPEGWSPYHP